MLNEILETAIAAARAGSIPLMSSFRRPGLEVQAKAAHDWVTRADRESEAAIVEAILGRFPGHRILGEEGGEQGAGGGGGFLWIVDPLDGTTNFLQGLSIFCISIACCRDGETVAGVVLDPVRNDLFTAVRSRGAWWNGQPMRVSTRPKLAGAYLATGFPFRTRAVLDHSLKALRQVFETAGAVRRCGSAALDLAYTAAGIFDGFWEFRLSTWDVAAGALLIQEAGGQITDLDGGSRFLAGGNIVAGSPGVHRDLLGALQKHVSEATLDGLDPQTSRPLTTSEDRRKQENREA